jgi:type IV pilus assembly protein PilQ
MLFNKMKNYKIFTGIANIHSFWLVSLTLIMFSVSVGKVNAEQMANSKLLGISYNTIQADQIELVFEFSHEISALPAVQTSMNPAYVEINFAATSYNDNLRETFVNHAGITNIILDDRTGQVNALVNLEKLSVFDVAIDKKQFSITFNYGQSAEVVEALSPAGEQFINQIDSLDFRLGANNAAEVLVYLEDSMVAVDVNDKLGKVNVEFHNTEIIEDLLYKLDVTDFGTVVTGIETFKEGRNARLVIDVNTYFEFSHTQEDNLFVLTITEK